MNLKFSKHAELFLAASRVSYFNNFDFLMFQLTHTFKYFVLLSMVTAVLGCAEENTGPDRYDVTGIVTFDGAPVAAGHVIFMADASKGNNGPSGTGIIKNGQYSTNGKGVVGGPYTVQVRGYDGEVDLEKERPLGKVLFPKYEFKVDFPSVDAQAGQPKDMNIDVPVDSEK